MNGVEKQIIQAFAEMEIGIEKVGASGASLPLFTSDFDVVKGALAPLWNPSLFKI